MTVRSQRRALTRSVRRADHARQLRAARAATRRSLRHFPAWESDLLTVAAGHQCRCGACGGRGDFPLAARFLPGWDEYVPAAVRAVHDAHRARVLALWSLLMARPERAAGAWLRLVLATIRVRAAVRVLVAAGLRRARAAASPLALPAIDLATSLDLSPPLLVATLAGGAAMPP